MKEESKQAKAVPSSEVTRHLAYDGAKGRKRKALQLFSMLICPGAVTLLQESGFQVGVKIQAQFSLVPSFSSLHFCFFLEQDVSSTKTSGNYKSVPSSSFALLYKNLTLSYRMFFLFSSSYFCAADLSESIIPLINNFYI